MGACSSKKTGGSRYKDPEKPTNCFIPINDTNTPLHLEFKLFNLKGKSFADNKESNTFVLPVVSKTNPKFFFEKYLNFQLPFNSLDSKYLILQIYSLPKSTDILKFKDLNETLAKANLYTSLRVDLLTIAIGPEHHDLCLMEEKKPYGPAGRISFNVICSHVEKIKLNLKNLLFRVDHLVQNEVVLKLKFKESILIESGYTSPIEPEVNQKEKTTIYSWIEPENDDGKLGFTYNMSMVELRSAAATINIYDVVLVNIDNNKQGQDGQKSSEEKNPAYMNFINSITRNENKNLPIQRLSQRFSCLKDMMRDDIIKLQPKYTPLGYANMNFYKILTENDNIITKQSSRFFNTFRSGINNPETPLINDSIKFQIYDNISKQFSEKIFSLGVEIGSLEGTVSITNIPLIRQIMCGVHTEKGFDISSIHVNLNYNLNSPSGGTMPQELITLSTSANNLLTQVLKFTNLTQHSQTSQETSKFIIRHMTEIKTVLEKSFKESALYYNYKNETDLYKSQKIMLELGINLLKLLESFKVDERVIAFKILTLINSRAEFDLGTVRKAWIGSEGGKSSIRDNILISDKIIENFIIFNNMCLDFCLQRLAKGKSVDKESKEFVEFFLPIAYFRIPKFRLAFIDAITQDFSEKQKDMNQNEDEEVGKFLDLDPINSLILWEIIFYHNLHIALRDSSVPESEIQDRLRDTQTIIDSSSEWKDRLFKKGMAFYSMIEKLKTYIEIKVVQNISIKWNNIPGFSTIIKVVSNELENKNINDYSPHLIESLSLFINDSDIINNFSKIMMHKTNVYDTVAVFTLVKILDFFFQNYEIKKSISNLNKRFDYNLLRLAGKIIMEIDHSLSVAKFLWLYYKNSHIMNFDHIAEVFIKTIEVRFFNLFFHWSWQVRNMFYFLILFIINCRLRNFNFQEAKQESTHKGMRRGSISNHSEVKHYIEELKNSLMNAYDEKMSIIDKLDAIVVSEHLDPSFNKDFKVFDKPEFSQIPKEVIKNIVIGIFHFKDVEREFLCWKGENMRKKPSEWKYPVLELEPPRDDVVQYSDNW